MNPFVSRITNQSWVVPVSLMCLVLGLMFSMAWLRKENRVSRVPNLSSDQQKRYLELAADPDKYAQMSGQLQKLMSDKTRLENAVANQSGNAKVLNESLQDLKLFAGLTEVEGTGVIVTLRDFNKSQISSPFITDVDRTIHDGDVLKVVNELFASGAEAISVNNLRVTAMSSYRCVGTTILVNDVKIASPVKIRAIGEVDTLLGAMTLPGGELALIKQTDASMAAVESAKYLRLPAFTGSTSHRVAKVPKEAK